MDPLNVIPEGAGSSSSSEEGAPVQRSSKPLFQANSNDRNLNDPARQELDHQVQLYQFHVGSYIRGIAFFLAINAVLMKFALDDKSQRLLYSVVAMLCALAILIPLRFGFRHGAKLAADFERLAKATGTQPVDTSPLAMLVRATFWFWLIIFSVWVYIFIRGL